MTLKLSYNEFDGLYQLLADAVENAYGGTDFEKKLRTQILVEIYVKFHSKSVIKKQQYTVTLAPREALCWWVLFNRHHLPPTSFLGNLLNKINNGIHQKFI